MTWNQGKKIKRWKTNLLSRKWIYEIIIPPLHHFTILVQKNAQNILRCYTVEHQSKTVDWRGARKWLHKTNQTLPCLPAIPKARKLACHHLSLFQFNQSNKWRFNGFACVVYVFRAGIMQLIQCNGFWKLKAKLLENGGMVE